MKIKRLTLTLPARFRASAEQDARRIAQEIAKQLNARTSNLDAANIAVTVNAQGIQGATLATAVGHHIVSTAKGNR